MYIGNNQITDVQLGTTDIAKVYLGTTLIWERISLTAFSISTLGTTQVNACDETADTTRYHDGAGSYPVNGDFVYTDSGGSNPFDGNNEWFKIGDGNIIQIADATGEVLNESVC